MDGDFSLTSIAEPLRRWGCTPLCQYSENELHSLVGDKKPIVRLLLRHRGKGPNGPMHGTRISISVLTNVRAKPQNLTNQERVTVEKICSPHEYCV